MQLILAIINMDFLGIVEITKIHSRKMPLQTGNKKSVKQLKPTLETMMLLTMILFYMCVLKKGEEMRPKEVYFWVES